MSEPPQQPLEAEAEEKVARQAGEKEDNDEDPLVIDEPEEKAAVAEVAETEEAKEEEDNEKEFEPTVDMLMNEFDDEQTIDEEEALGQEDDGTFISIIYCNSLINCVQMN